jgi:hypothetical protein
MKVGKENQSHPIFAHQLCLIEMIQQKLAKKSEESKWTTSNKSSYQMKLFTVVI